MKSRIRRTRGWVNWLNNWLNNFDWLDRKKTRILIEGVILMEHIWLNGALHPQKRSSWEIVLIKNWLNSTPPHPGRAPPPKTEKTNQQTSEAIDWLNKIEWFSWENLGHRFYSLYWLNRVRGLCLNNLKKDCKNWIDWPIRLNNSIDSIAWLNWLIKIDWL